MLPVIIIAVIVIPLLILSFVQIRRRNAAGESLAGTDASQEELDREIRGSGGRRG